MAQRLPTARRSSAKSGDVDAVWTLLTQPGSEDDEVFVDLGLERRRGSAHPDRILVLDFDGLAFGVGVREIDTAQDVERLILVLFATTPISTLQRT